MATLALSAQDLATLIGRLAAPTVGRVRAEVTADALRLSLLEIDLPTLRRGVVLLLTADVPAPNVIRLHIAIERAGPLAPIIRLFLTPLLRKIIAKLGATDVATIDAASTITLHVAAIRVGDAPLGDQLTVSSLALPAAPYAARCVFTIHDRRPSWNPTLSSMPPRWPPSPAAPV